MPSHAASWSRVALGLSALLPPLCLMGLILWLGTGRASAAQTRSLLEEIVQSLFPPLHARMAPEHFAAGNVLIRKAGHFGGYMLLALLNARCLRLLLAPAAESAPRPERAAAAAWTAWAAAALWAALDELHQSRSPSRGATVEDVVLDAAGAAAGAFLYFRWTSRPATPA